MLHTRNRGFVSLYLTRVSRHTKFAARGISVCCAWYAEHNTRVLPYLIRARRIISPPKKGERKTDPKRTAVPDPPLSQTGR
eukprot:819945-Rhodomonas_salina.1